MAKSRKPKATRDEGPIPYEEIERRESAPATARPPADLRGARSLYVTTPKDAAPKPTVRAERVEGPDAAPAVWRIDVELGAAVETHRPGVAHTSLVAPSERSRRAATVRPLDGHRPAWMSVSYRPRLLSPPTRVLQEFQGRRYRPLYIFAPDDRVILFDESYPWSTMGKVVTSDGTSGSATLVGSRTILTARHVRPDRSIAAGSWWVKFTPHAFDGAAPFGSSYVSNLHYYTPTGDGHFDIAHDYMVCRLFDPLGDRLGYCGTTSYNDSWEDLSVWASVGYPEDVSGGQRPVVQVPCTIVDDYEYGDGQVLETRADLNHGQSGGPFWAWFKKADGGDTARIVGVVSGEVDFSTGIIVPIFHDHSNALATGADMVGLVDWARANWT